MTWQSVSWCYSGNQVAVDKMYQINRLHTLNLHSVKCPLNLNKKVKRKRENKIKTSFKKCYRVIWKKLCWQNDNPSFRKVLTPSPLLPKQRREVPVGLRLLMSATVTPHNFVVQYLPSSRRKAGHWLWLWCLLTHLDHAPWCALRVSGCKLPALQMRKCQTRRMVSHRNATHLQKTELMVSS